MRSIKYLLLLVLVLVFCIAKGEKKKILVLHSYHQGLNWTDNITRGILSIFDENDKIEVQFEYMDTKRNSDPAYIEEFSKLYDLKHHNIPFKAIIASDNAALEFVRKYQNKFFKDIPIIFTCIDQFEEKLIEGMTNVSGVTEYIDFKKTIEVALSLHPKAKNLVVINDNISKTAIINRNFIKSFWPQIHSNVNLIFLENLSIENLKRKVKNLDNSNIILLINFSEDLDGDYISYQENIDILREITDLPIYSSWEFYLNEGIVGGMLTSGFKQGTLSAGMVMQVINGEDINKIPIIKEGYNSFMFDYNELKRLGISIDKLPKNSIITNMPPSFLEKNKISLIIILVFIIFTALTSIYSYLKRIRSERRLLEENAELDRRVARRTEELTRANKMLVHNQEQILKKDTEISRRKLAEEQNKEIERKILNAIIKTEETERKRFAKDLHDSIGPLLSSINLYLSALSGDVEKEKREDIVKHTREVLNEAVISVKEISNNLSPHILNDFGIKIAIESFTKKLSLTKRIDISFNAENLDSRLNEQVEVVIYRVVTELINNTIKHANASHIEINLSKEKDELRLIYINNGKGFDSKKALENPENGMGLYNILSRVHSLNGTHKIKSVEGQMGMMAIISIPLL